MTGSGVVETGVCVIGGGLVGCSTALHLARESVPVVVLERDSVGSRASGVNFGGVRRHGRHCGELPLAIRSRVLWGDLQRLVGSDCEFEASGHLKFAVTGAQMAELEAWAVTGREFGVDVELLGSAELTRRFPWAAPGLAGASFCPGDGQANPRLAGPAFARAARERGARIIEGCAVTGLEPAAVGYRILTQDGPEIRAERVVNAAGAWAARFASLCGEPAPVEPVAPQMHVTEPVTYRIRPAVGVVGAGIYLRQIPRGNVIFGGGRGAISTDGLRSRPLAAGMCATMTLAGKLIPHLIGVTVIRSWTGIEGNMPDGLPVLSESTRHPGVYHAFGFSGHGFQMAPAVGAVLADLVIRGRTDTDIGSFRIDRF